MSKMELLGAIGFSLALVSLTQIPNGAEGCRLQSATPSGPWSILVKWEEHVGASRYFLDLRVKNNTNFAPVVVTLPSTAREREVNGLRPGTEYSVTLKVFHLFSVICADTIELFTVPDTAQILVGRPLSSSSILVVWTPVPSADYYRLLVRAQATGQTLNISTIDTVTIVGNLQPTTIYDCYVYTVNQAGSGGPSQVQTVTTRG